MKPIKTLQMLSAMFALTLTALLTAASAAPAIAGPLTVSGFVA